MAKVLRSLPFPPQHARPGKLSASPVNNITILHFLHCHKSAHSASSPSASPALVALVSFEHRAQLIRSSSPQPGAEPVCPPRESTPPQDEISPASAVPADSCAPASALGTTRRVKGRRQDGGGADLPPAAGSASGCAGFRGASVADRGEGHAHRPGNGRGRRARNPRLTVAARPARCASARLSRACACAALPGSPWGVASPQPSSDFELVASGWELVCTHSLAHIVLLSPKF